MRLRALHLDEQDQAIAQTIISFLKDRLSMRDTVEWALSLGPMDIVKRAALLELISLRSGDDLKEPWLTAWRLIEESWSNQTTSYPGGGAVYQVHNRLSAGDRSGSVIGELASLVAPRLKLRKNSGSDARSARGVKKVRCFDDLLQVSISSPPLLDIGVLRLDDIVEIDFLVQLANALDACVQSGLDIAQRLGWDGERQLWRLGFLYRVEYGGSGRDEDEYHEGIGPSVKLLHAVVHRISEISPLQAVRFIRQWIQVGDPIHLRLWASFSKDKISISADEVEGHLLLLNDQKFWNVHDYPEIATLRAVRFSEFSTGAQNSIFLRIKKGPPASFWVRPTPIETAKNIRLYWSLRELRRIEVAGSELATVAKKWLEDHIHKFPELSQMTELEEGYLSGKFAQLVHPDPDTKYDHLSGEQRLRALEAALSSGRTSWNDDPAERANDWINSVGNVGKILCDFKADKDSVGNYPLVWGRFGWCHSPVLSSANAVLPDSVKKDGELVISLLMKLPAETACRAIEGLSHWMSSWQSVIALSDMYLPIWQKYWPIAVEKTNLDVVAPRGIELNLVVQSSGDQEPKDLDTLNTPAGRLVGVFLASCPPLKKGIRNPFTVNATLNYILGSLVSAEGRAGLIAKHRLIEHIGYFHRADKEWTDAHLIKALSQSDENHLALWRAIARRRLFSPVLKKLKAQIVTRITDQHLGRDTRKSLLSSVVLDSLHSLLNNKRPAIEFSAIQQLIRAVEDEVRADAAQVVQRFVTAMSGSSESNVTTRTPELLFFSAVIPFLKQIWPPERSLVTPGVSAAFADLPASVGQALPEAVEAVEPFLMPFNCWSLLDFGFRDRADGKPVLSLGDDKRKAGAILRLLDATIGASDSAVIPVDLDIALGQISEAAPEISSTQAFRRLATLARRR